MELAKKSQSVPGGKKKRVVGLLNGFTKPSKQALLV